MKTLLTLLLSFILFSFNDIPVNGFKLSLSNTNMLSVYSDLEENILSKEIEITGENKPSVYLYRKATCYKTQLRIYLPENTYTITTTVTYKDSTVIKDKIILKTKPINESK